MAAEDFNLRDALRADFEALWRLDQICFEPGIAYSQRELQYYINGPGAVTLVAEGQSSIAGFLVMIPKGDARAHLITIDVHPDMRREGLGSRLLQEAQNRLQSRSVGWIDLEVAVDNLQAIRFYKRHGFHVRRTLPRYYKDELDALEMSKAIGQE